jgi:acyl-coenzyme A synthetase/AMP-(fatty) acid ligase
MASAKADATETDLPKTATGKVQKYVLRGKPAISKQ